MDDDRLEGWVPIRVDWTPTGPVVDWCHFGTRRLVEPFFDQTVGAALRRPFSVLFRHRTPLDDLVDWPRTRPSLPAAGFIFHMSRCGSTLLGQMLAALPRHVVLSEAGPIDTVLRAPDGVDPDRHIAWLRGLVAALGRRRNEGESRLFIKFDCWHARNLPLIRRAFPDVPWVFLYRDPVEVLVSQRRQCGAQMIPGVIDPRVFDLDVDMAALAALPPEDYCARVLASVCRSGLQALQDDRGGRPLHHRQLPDAAWTIVADHFGLDLDDADRDAMRLAARFDAKNPVLPYQDDSSDKQRQANDSVRLAAETWVRPLYDRLEALRPGRSP
jgi:hypothetical protein